MIGSSANRFKSGGKVKDGMSSKEHSKMAEHHLKAAHEHMKMASGVAIDPTIERGENKRPYGEHAVQEKGKTRGTQVKMKSGGSVKRK